MVRTLPNPCSEYLYAFSLNRRYQHMMVYFRLLKEDIRASKIYEIEGGKYLRPSVAHRNAVLRERAKIVRQWRGCAQYGKKAP